jgi:hypothetical protein
LVIFFDKNRTEPKMITSNEICIQRWNK